MEKKHHHHAERARGRVGSRERERGGKRQAKEAVAAAEAERKIQAVSRGSNDTKSIKRSQFERWFAGRGKVEKATQRLPASTCYLLLTAADGAAVDAAAPSAAEVRASLLQDKYACLFVHLRLHPLPLLLLLAQFGVQQKAASTRN